MCSTLEVADRRVTTFYGLKEIAKEQQFTEIRASNNELSSFEHFGTNPSLVKLDVEHNQISSFAGMTRQKSLEDLRIAGNPVSLHPQCRVMALLTIGFSLRVVDGVPIESSERELARRLGPSAALAVSYGWLLDDLRPKTNEEYDAVIVELRKAKKQRTVDSARVCSIPMVLAEHKVGQSDFYEHDPRQSKAMADTIELQNKALLHFSKRVTQLEFQVAELQATLQREREQKRRLLHAESQSSVESKLHRRCETIIGLSGKEISTAVEAVVLPSVVIQTNVPLGPLMPSTSVRCVVQISQTMFTVLHFFTRSRILETRMSDVVRASFNPSSKTAVLQLRGGCIVEVQCDAELSVAVLHKLLYIAIGEPAVPSLLSDLSEEVRQQSTVQFAAVSNQTMTSRQEAATISEEHTHNNPKAKADDAEAVEASSALRSSGRHAGVPSARADHNSTTPKVVPTATASPLSSTPPPQQQPLQSSSSPTESTSSSPSPPPPSRSVPASQSIGAAAAPTAPPATLPPPTLEPTAKAVAVHSEQKVSSPPPPMLPVVQKDAPSESPTLVAHSLQDRTATKDRTASASDDSSDDDVAAMLPAARKAAPLARATVKSAPPPIPKRANSSERTVSSDERQASPPPPPPKRTLWRGKEIQDLLIASSDSDSDG